MKEELLHKYESSGGTELLPERQLLDRVLDRFPGCLRLTTEQWRAQRRKALKHLGLPECELLGRAACPGGWLVATGGPAESSSARGIWVAASQLLVLGSITCLQMFNCLPSHAPAS